MLDPNNPISSKETDVAVEQHQTSTIHPHPSSITQSAAPQSKGNSGALLILDLGKVIFFL